MEKDFDREELIRQAREQQKKAYAPYSGYQVAAAVLMDSGKVYTGVNVENASYPAGICAERNAIFHAAACGERRITAIAVVAGLRGENTHHVFARMTDIIMYTGLQCKERFSMFSLCAGLKFKFFAEFS